MGGRMNLYNSNGAKLRTLPAEKRLLWRFNDHEGKPKGRFKSAQIITKPGGSGYIAYPVYFKLIIIFLRG